MGERVADPPVAVIGAGYAGLAAAVALAASGRRVRVFEAAQIPGGRARRVVRGDRILDNGQHILVGAYAALLGMMRFVGADPERLLRRIPLTLAYPGRMELRAAALPAPLHLLMARARGIGLGGRLALARLLRAVRAPVDATAEDETVAAFLERLRQPEELRALIWEPLCVSALNTPAESASARVFARVLRDTLLASRADSDLLLPAADLTRLFPEPACRFIAEHAGEVALATTISAVRHTGEDFQLDGDASLARYENVVVAVAPHRLPSLLDPLAPLAPLIDWASRLRHLPILTCYLHYPRPVALPAPMVGHADGFAQWFLDRGQLGGPPGMIAAVSSARAVPDGLSREALGQRVHRELCQLAGDLPQPVAIDIISEKRATFACVPGLQRPRPDTAVPGLLLAGDYVDSPYPATLEAAVRSGLACARLIAGALPPRLEELCGSATLPAGPAAARVVPRQA